MKTKIINSLSIGLLVLGITVSILGTGMLTQYADAAVKCSTTNDGTTYTQDCVGGQGSKYTSPDGTVSSSSGGGGKSSVLLECTIGVSCDETSSVSGGGGNHATSPTGSVSAAAVVI